MRSGQIEDSRLGFAQLASGDENGNS